MSCCSLSFCCSSSSRSSLQGGKNKHILSVTLMCRRIQALESNFWAWKGVLGKEKSAFFSLSAALTYSPGPDWGSGITLLLLPIFTVPAIWAIRSCQLQQKQQIKPCSKWNRMSISLFNPLKPSWYYYCFSFQKKCLFLKKSSVLFNPSPGTPWNHHSIKLSSPGCFQQIETTDKTLALARSTS